MMPAAKGTVRYVVCRLNRETLGMEWLERVSALFVQEEWIWTADRSRAFVWAIGPLETYEKEAELKKFALSHCGHKVVASDSDQPGTEVPSPSAKKAALAAKVTTVPQRVEPEEAYRALQRRYLA